MKQNVKKFIFFVGLSLVFLCTLVGTSRNVVEPTVIGNATATSDRQLHPQITFTSNLQLDVFFYGNGTDGLSPSTAYVLKDYMIDGGKNGSCIKFIDTTRYVIMLNCEFFNSGNSTTDAGIELLNSKNINITGCNVHDNNHGIYFRLSSDDGIIAANEITNQTGNGIFLQNVDNTTIQENVVTNNRAGISLDDSSHANILDSNTVSGNLNYGIFINGTSNNNHITGNTVSATAGGDGIFIEDNSDGCVITANEIFDNFNNGLTINENCDDMDISRNALVNNGNDGVTLDSGDNCTFHHNRFVSNTHYGLGLAGNATSNTIYLNEFSGNVVDNIHGAATIGTAMFYSGKYGN